MITESAYRSATQGGSQVLLRRKSDPLLGCIPIRIYKRRCGCTRYPNSCSGEVAAGSKASNSNISTVFVPGFIRSSFSILAAAVCPIAACPGKRIPAQHSSSLSLYGEESPRPEIPAALFRQSQHLRHCRHCLICIQPGYPSLHSTHSRFRSCRYSRHKRASRLAMQ